MKKTADIQTEAVNLLFLMTVVSALFGSAVIGVIPFFSDNALAGLLASQLMLASPAAWYMKRMYGRGKLLHLDRLRIRKAFLCRELSFATVVLLILFAFAIIPVLSFINCLSMLFTENVIAGTVGAITDKFPLLISLVAVAVIPALLEEWIYRGIFFLGYGMENRGRAALVSGLLFGLLHLNWNQFLYAFVMGVLFSIIVEAAGSIYASVLVHFWINGTSLVLTYLMPGMKEAPARNTIYEALPVYGTNAIVGAVLSILLLFLIERAAGRTGMIRKNFMGEREGARTILTPPLLFGIAVCLLVMFLI